MMFLDEKLARLLAIKPTPTVHQMAHDDFCAGIPRILLADRLQPTRRPRITTTEMITRARETMRLLGVRDI